MVGLTYVWPCLLFIPFASAGMTAALLRVAGLSDAEALHSAKDYAAQTLQSLDVNLDGCIDQSEVATFANNEGLDEASATDDFSGLDTNGDGVLDPAELLQVLGGNATAVHATPAPKSLRAATPVPAPQAVSVREQPHTIKGPAAEKPAATRTAKREAKISIQEPHPARVLEVKQEAQAPQPPKAQQPPQASAPPQMPLVTQGVRPTPVERMVKHFAQVLRTADVRPVHEERGKLAKSAMSSKPLDDIVLAKDTRASVQSAAKEVAEQLAVSETAEAEARVLDRRAAEERANATVLAKLTMQEALNAGAAAAHSKAKESLAKIAKLEDQAERAQVRSAAMHSKSKLESEEASELMSVADKAMNPL